MRTLVAAASASRIQLLEAAGATAVVIGLTQWLGGPAGWIAAGLALLGKSLEWDMRGGDRQ
ncbi:MAG: hypothetical protein ACRD0W_02150 [Acidimicrobiales bacterium]